jgi:hypothetical protein
MTHSVMLLIIPTKLLGNLIIYSAQIALKLLHEYTIY